MVYCIPLIVVGMEFRDVGNAVRQWLNPTQDVYPNLVKAAMLTTAKFQICGIQV